MSLGRQRAVCRWLEWSTCPAHKSRGQSRRISHHNRRLIFRDHIRYTAKVFCQHVRVVVVVVAVVVVVLARAATSHHAAAATAAAAAQGQQQRGERGGRAERRPSCPHRRARCPRSRASTPCRVPKQPHTQLHGHGSSTERIRPAIEVGCCTALQTCYTNLHHLMYCEVWGMVRYVIDLPARGRRAASRSGSPCSPTQGGS